MRFIYFALLTLLSFPSLGQGDSVASAYTAKLKSFVSDSSSNFYYPSLLKEIKSDPGSINRDQLFYLYYGQVVQSGGRKPSFISNPEYGEFMKMVYAKKFKRVVEIGYKILDRNPVELEVLLHTMIALNETKQDDPRFLSKTYRLLLDVIKSTGDGKTKSTAIQIAKVDHDGIIKGALGFLGGEETLDFSDGKAYSVWTKKDGSKLYFEDVWTYSFGE